MERFQLGQEKNLRCPSSKKDRRRRLGLFFPFAQNLSSQNLLHTQALLRDTPLIPVELLYGQPLATDPQISPDGAWLSYLAPSPPNNTLNVFIVPLRNGSTNSSSSSSSGPQQQQSPPKAFQLTRESAFDIDPGQYQWSPDSHFILYLFDRDPKVGDRYRLWRKDVSRPGEEAVDLLPEFSTTKRSSLAATTGGNNSNKSESFPPAPSNRTLPPGLMGDNLHIGQFFLSEKVPVRRKRERKKERKTEEEKNEKNEEKNSLLDG